MSMFSESNALENIAHLKALTQDQRYHQFYDNIGRDNFQIFTDHVINTILSVCTAKTLKLTDMGELANLQNFHPFKMFMSNSRPCETKEVVQAIEFYIDSICALRDRKLQASQIFHRLLYLLRSTFNVPLQARNFSVNAQCSLKLDSEYKVPQRKKLFLTREIQQVRQNQLQAVLHAQRQVFTFNPANGRVNLEGPIIPDLIEANVILQFCMLNECVNQGINAKPYLDIPENILLDEA